MESNNRHWSVGHKRTMSLRRAFVLAALLAVVLALAWSVPSLAYSDDLVTTQLTNRPVNANARAPQVSDGRVVWFASDGTADQIFTWTAATGTVQITSVAYGDDAGFPQVSGDRIVWQQYDSSIDASSSAMNGSEIYTWTPSSGIVRITSNAYPDRLPQVSGDRVVWQEREWNDSEIYTWTPSGGVVQVTSNSYWDSAPKVSGDRIVWTGNDEIYTWTPAGGLVQLTSNATKDSAPDVSGDRIVWAGSDSGSDHEVFTWTPAGGVVQLTSDTANDSTVPHVSGDRVVWVGKDNNGNFNVYLWTAGGQGPVKISTTQYVGSPQISGDRVVWSGCPSDGAHWDIYVWTPSTSVTSLGPTGYNSDLEVSGNRVVWINTSIKSEPGTFTEYGSDVFTAVAKSEISGIVRDGNGEDLAGATVVARLHSSDSNFDSSHDANNLVGTATTDANGEYVIDTDGFGGEGLSLGSIVEVTASKGGYLTVSQYGVYDRLSLRCSFDDFATLLGIPWQDRRLPVNSGQDALAPFHYLLPNYAVDVPAISSLSPQTGPTGGGTTVTINGTGFFHLAGSSAVTFGDVDAASYTVVSDTRITAVAPAHAAGSMSVRVKAAGGTSFDTASDAYAYVVPTVASLSPNSGSTAGGASVTITGTGFAGLTAADAVTFDGVNAASYTVNSNTSITAIAPAHVAGTVRVRIKDAGDVSADTFHDDFTYVERPTITSLSPSTGATAGNTLVHISGTNFTGATKVTFDGVNAVSFSLQGSTLINAYAPAHALGTVEVQVTSSGGTTESSSADEFTYVGTPGITSVSPAFGPVSGGNTVVITGTGFQDASAVAFGPNKATSYTVDSTTQITAVAPSHAAGWVTVKVTAPGGSSAEGQATSYRYGSPVNAGFAATRVGSVDSYSYPEISGDRIVWLQAGGSNPDVYTWTPSSGRVRITNDNQPDTLPSVWGDRVVWRGYGTSYFLRALTWTPTGGVTQVSSNNNDEYWPVIRDGRIAWLADCSTECEIVTCVPGGAQTAIWTSLYEMYPEVSANRVVWDDIYDGADPEVFTWTPAGGAVRLTNNNLYDGYAVVSGDRVVWMRYDGTDWEICTWTPAGGFVQITSNSVDDYYPEVSGDRIVWTRGAYDGCEVCTWTPTTGTVQLTSNSKADWEPQICGDRVVWTGDDGTDSEIFTWTPGAGTAQVTNNESDDDSPVVSPARIAWTGQEDSSWALYTAVPAPTISSVTPAIGSTAGGTSVVIKGTGFSGLSGSSAVTFGGVDAKSYVVNSSTQITAVAPAGSVGTVDVVVTAAGGASIDSGTLNHFTYAEGPTVTSITPSSAHIAGGTTVVIQGSNFTGLTGAAAVKFGGTNATSYTVNSATKITATVPAHAAGTVDVVVTGSIGSSPTAGAADDFSYYNLSRFQQGDTRLTYSSGWSTYSGATFSGGSYSYSNAAGATVAATFTGTQLDWITIKGPNYGIANVSVDGGTATQVDLYAPANLFQEKVYSTGTLSNGIHKVAITYTGTKNTSATGAYIGVDAFDTDGSLVTVANVEQNDSHLFFTGTWSTYSNAAFSGGSYYYSAASNASATIPFNGQKLDWVALKGPAYGIADVSVDGGTPTQVDLYASANQFKQVVYSTPVLANGLHAVKISYTGAKNSSATGTSIDVDSFKLVGTIATATRFEQTNTKFVWAKTWTLGTSAYYSGGNYRYVNLSGASVTINFTGCSLNYIATKARNMGKAYVKVDGGAAVLVDLYSLTTAYRQNVFSTGALTPGNHTVTITWSGQRRTGATGSIINIDAVDVIGTLR